MAYIQPWNRGPSPRGPYLQSVASHSVWVVWDTVSPTLGRVEYGTTPELGQEVVEKLPVPHHEVLLNELEPYTTYFYRVDSGSTASFRTAPSSGQSGFRFVVYGDNRGGYSTHRTLVKQMVEMEPDFVLHTGDLVESGRANSEWDIFFRIAGPLLQSAPFFPTLGNHEDNDPKRLGSHYTEIFHLPGNELWYAFDYGNARFISLKVDGFPLDTYLPDEEQLTWLERQLSSNDAPWLIVYFHIGIYTSREEGFLEVGIRELLAPLFERYGVNIVFMGHHHSYERILVNGITYIVTAGGGATLYDLSQPELGSQVALKAHHFVVLDLEGEHLQGKTIDRGGKVIDSFELAAER